MKRGFPTGVRVEVAGRAGFDPAAVGDSIALSYNL